jgi:hypothetical protein
MARRISLDKGTSIMPEQCFDKVKTKGRPRLKLNDLGIEIITKLAGFMCTEEEIASFLGVTVETLHNKDNYNTFLECIKNGQNIGKVSLRQNQFNLSKTNPTMAIWLGKQYLGQRELQETEKSTENSKGIKFEFTDTSIEGVNNE